MSLLALGSIAGSPIAGFSQVPRSFPKSISTTEGQSGHVQKIAEKQVPAALSSILLATKGATRTIVPATTGQSSGMVRQRGHQLQVYSGSQAVALKSFHRTSAATQGSIAALVRTAALTRAAVTASTSAVSRTLFHAITGLQSSRGATAHAIAKQVQALTASLARTVHAVQGVTLTATQAMTGHVFRQAALALGGRSSNVATQNRHAQVELQVVTSSKGAARTQFGHTLVATTAQLLGMRKGITHALGAQQTQGQQMTKQIAKTGLVLSGMVIGVRRTVVLPVVPAYQGQGARTLIALTRVVEALTAQSAAAHRQSALALLALQARAVARHTTAIKDLPAQQAAQTYMLRQFDKYLQATSLVIVALNASKARPANLAAQSSAVSAVARQTLKLLDAFSGTAAGKQRLINKLIVGLSHSLDQVIIVRQYWHPNEDDIIRLLPDVTTVMLPED